MNIIKSFLTDIDIFGITIAFSYKNRIKYKSPYGGFFLVLFLILLFSLAIYYFIPFFNRKNYTVVYYTMNLASTEEVNLFSSGSNIAFGLSCEGTDSKNLKIEDLLDLQTKFIIYSKSIDGNYVKYPSDILTHKCNYADFFYEYNNQMDYLGLKQFESLTNKNYIIQGIYSDQIFSYFEISALAKNTSIELLNEIERFLFENDCKFDMAFTDMIIDLDNYENPMTQYLNDEIFIQLNPTFFMKKNIYFMNQEFINDNYLLFIIGDDETLETKILYSRYEEYTLWKGTNRAITKPSYYDYFSKVYIRADLKKTVIKRRYQKFTEFFADSFSILMAIFEILCIIFYFIYNFSAYYNLSKKLFFFKEVDNESSFKFFNNIKQIQDLIYITDIKENNQDINSINIKSRNNKNISLNKNFSANIENLYIKEKNEGNKKGIILYNNLNKNLELNQIKVFSYLKETEKINYYESPIFQRQLCDISKNKFKENFKKNKKILINKKDNKNDMQNCRESDRVKIYSSGSDRTSMGESLQDSEKTKKKKRVEYSFNIFEIIIILLCKCCLSKKMALKNKANEKSNEIIFKKLDINTYIRNMILFDLINKMIFDNDKIPIINFLCRPIISVNKKEKSKFDLFYRTYRQKDFDKFSEQIIELAEKTKDKDEQIKLISLSHEHLKTLV